MKGKLKYQGGITKLLCSKLAVRNKKLFLQEVKKGNLLSEVKPTQVNFDVISFSGVSSFEDQILSIYTFLYYIGTPIKWTIYSDKSYTAEQIAIFKKLFAFVDVLDWDVYNYIKDDKSLTEYLDFCPLAKKVNLIIGHPFERQTLYVDSDILFYKNFKTYIDSGLLNKGLWYVPDALGNLTDAFSVKREYIYALNSGLLFINKEFNKQDVFDYFKALNGNYHYFSEQSSFEYAYRKQHANMLDPRQFIIDSSDQFDFSTSYYPADIAMRHYTSPVRHKIWQNGWRWHFKY